jgi:hypothetical protein
VPQARTAILRWFHLGGATVERVDTLPRAVERAGLGRPASLAGAQREVGFRLALPVLPARPRVYVLGNSLATVILRVHGRPVLLSEFRSTSDAFLKKLTIGATTVEPARFGRASGLWIEGAPHTITYFNRAFGLRETPILVRGNVLLWLHGPLTLRLEGKLTKAQAVDFARSIR